MVLQSSWDIRVYDLDGAELAQVTEATNRQLHFPLNGIDSCSFSLYLNDPLIDPTQGGTPSKIRTLDRTLKVWRTITDVTNPGSPVTLYQSPANTPDFAGFITRAEKTGQSNMFNVLAQAPLWRLQPRFHLENHYLVIDYVGQANPPPTPHQGGNEDGLAWDISALMFRLIDFVQGAFGGDSYNGIKKPLTGPPFWTKTLQMAPFRISRGDNTWTLFSTLLGQIGGPDLVPQYIHSAGLPDLMYFKTAPYRGSDKSSTVSLDYYTGNFNLDDFVELEEVVPDKFANYVWGVGQGGPNVTRAIAWDKNDTTLGTDGVGVYMHIVENETIQTGTGSVLQDNADAELKKTHARPKTYALLVAPMTVVYGVDFTVGDVVKANAAKGALQVTNLKQRLYEATINMTDNNVELIDLTVADDFFSKIPLG